MSDIRLRAWDSHSDEMITKFLMGSVVDDNDNEWTCPLTWTGSDWVNNDCLEIMRSTGVKDLNGDLIYEGDILHQLDPTVWNPFAVEYCDNTSCFLAGGTVTKSNVKDCELVIIGNIHQNKGLLVKPT